MQQGDSGQQVAAMADTVTTTWNGALSVGTASECPKKATLMKLFFHAMRKTGKDDLDAMLQACCDAGCLSEALVLAFYLRDCRGGKGERALGRRALVWFARTQPALFAAAVPLVPLYGRWDDLVYVWNKVEALRDEVMAYFVEVLKEDLETPEGQSISLAAKWVPSEGARLDKRHFARELARAMSLGPSNAALRQQVISPLRKRLALVETKLCAKQWHTIVYEHVPSCAMLRLRKQFCAHDKERFDAYLAEVAAGRKQLKHKQLFPHEVVAATMGESRPDPVLEQQWAQLLQDAREAGDLSGCVAMVDVSGSMTGASGKVVPLHAALALGIMIAQCGCGPYKDAILTFTAEAALFPIHDATEEDNTLWATVRRTERAPWGMSTNFQSAFQLLLSQGAEHLPRTLFVFSDMQFDVAGRDSTNLEVIKQTFRQRELPMPRLVFWNLNGSISDFPCTVHEEGVLLVSGYSPSILSTVLKVLRGERCEAYDMVAGVLESDRYEAVRQLKVKAPSRCCVQ